MPVEAARFTVADAGLRLGVPDAVGFRYAWAGGREYLVALVAGNPPPPAAAEVTLCRCLAPNCGHRWPEPGRHPDRAFNCPLCGSDNVRTGESGAE